MKNKIINYIKDLEKINLINFVFLTIAGITSAIGITMFLTPGGVFDSGIAGTSMLLAKLTPLTIPTYLSLLNLPIFILGYKKQGISFTIYSVFAVTIYSIAVSIIINNLPSCLNSSPFAGNDILLCSIFGGILIGLGGGIAIRFGGAIDGMEALAVVFAKKLNLSIGSFVMAYSSILYIICGIVMDNWRVTLYSILSYMAALKTVNYIVDGIDRAKSIIITTSHGDDVCEALSEKFKCGMTVVESKGYYSNENKTCIYIILNRFQISSMRSLVKVIDKKAYIAVSDVADVYKHN